MFARNALLMSLGSLVLAAPAAADAARPAPTAELYACTDIAEDTARLACFDAAVAALRSAESAGEVQTIDRTELEAIERDAFGFSLPTLPQMLRRNSSEEDEIKAVTKRLDRISTDPSGALLFYLADGQVWRQVDSKSVPKSKIRRAEEVTIKRASLGSFRLVIDGTGAGIRVRRLN